MLQRNNEQTRPDKGIVRTMPDKAHTPRNRKAFQNPKGTRDFYPEDLLKRRYIESVWRRVALRHGFDEIDGPTFEHLDLYTVKSGEGIVSELFSFTRHGGDETYALRPEFTPTLARMYAARAKQLPVPTKWFCIPNFFRAERPQRGRLREFLQWNVDAIGGDDSALMDAELIECVAGSLEAFGLTHDDARICASDRAQLENFVSTSSPSADCSAVFALLDKRAKLPDDEFAKQASAISFDISQFDGILREKLDSLIGGLLADNPWVVPDSSIVRGLAYYTGTVFEIIADGERAIAGGGRYDNLIELMGGPPTPPTPAVGFAMGDVVLANLLEDKGLMPEGRDLLDALDEPVPTRCEAFVIPNGSEEAEAALAPTLAQLRKGEREAGSVSTWAHRPVHARRSYKATRNVGKLLKEANAVHAKYAVILESGEHATVQNLDTKEKHENVSLDKIASKLI
ncbi:ATP phosphoribosyltransferase regulatory subunit [Planctomycetaceae bacterium AH-315-I19]|nr:ATP phosphoribosyltransferase regulatory subunit [Planctomycetaceae bacterium AH-315-I19]